MVKKVNPWLPWVDTIKLPSAQDEGNILVIIPTAGNDLKRLKRCLDSLNLAAEKEKIHIVIVISPITKQKEKNVKKLCGNYAEIVSLKGTFNYCHSINEGLSRKHLQDKCVLFLNDDVTFTKRGDLSLLKKTLREQRWACIGPYINYNPFQHDSTWPKEKSSLGIPRAPGAIRTNLPVSGSCILWDIEWLNRIGKLDEEFGVGWGMDEADLCIRAVRLGARYGHQDVVAINHIMHATFESKYTKYTGPAHMRSLNYFKKKYGKEVEEWGRSHHWWPLSGIQVIISACEDPKQFKRCLDNVERDLRGFRWILLIGNIREEKIYKIARNYCCKYSSADKCEIRKFINDKLNDTDIFIKMVKIKSPLSKQYPAIYFIDSNEEISATCVKELLWWMRDNGHIAGKIGNRKTISEKIIASINFTALLNKKGDNYKELGSIFHVKAIPKELLR